ncbi:hypothetical protein [Sphingobacterium deserti]|uniref:Uncharacterized protein n=1 Tax=Sphingobacterium deserti TaxID=1229276 RepID=A0A0B8T0K9_9SPHI|nr:hypothetical protein [Sphingobacterium deserti]KGE13911.1 hypothetical protein DI53_2323 [Sphingobacterium deserti]
MKDRLFTIKIETALILLTFVVLISCKKVSSESFYAEDVPMAEMPDLTEEFTFGSDKGLVNISTQANGNNFGTNNSALYKNISSQNFAYCHPDVEYFPEGFNGYKYWMVFTPYFGSVGTAQDAKLYENPSVVVSNDGLNWVEPKGLKNPIQGALSAHESITENKNERKQGFWSDVDWFREDGKFFLYYRGSMVSAAGLGSRGAKSLNNKSKLKENAQRTIVRQTSSDGVHWTPLEVVYTSNPPATPKSDHLLSPTFIPVDNIYISYEVELHTGGGNFKGDEQSYVVRRQSKDGLNFSVFDKSQVINFVKKPWKNVNQAYSPWHIQASYVDGYYFLVLAIGDVKKYTSDLLYLAFSKDGLNYNVVPKPIVESNAYRSAIFKKNVTSDYIDFGAILGFKNGAFSYREFRLEKLILDKACK